jgi:adenylyl cyclase-associated protein
MEEQIVPSVSRGELTAIVRRLEAATSRLEDIASATLESPPATAQSNANGPPTTAPTGPLPPPPPPPAPKEVVEPIPATVEEFDNFLSGALKKYVVLSDGLGGAIAEQVSSLSCT